jgi:DNA-directed RNA polymerase specialized sigma24 family protein
VTRQPNERRLDEDAWARLLAFLDGDPVRAGEKYEAARRRLTQIFRWRALSSETELADEVFDRVARKLAAGLEVRTTDPMRYLAGVADLVALEASRQEQRLKPLDATPIAAPAGEGPEPEVRRRCLDRCLDALDPRHRELLLRYHAGEGAARISGRKALAEEMSIPLNALRIRVHRLRGQLDECMKGCVSGEMDRIDPAP